MADNRNDRKGGKRSGHGGKGDSYRGRKHSGTGRGKRSEDRRDNRRGGRSGGDTRKSAPKKQKAHQGEYRSENPNEPVIPAGVAAADLDEAALKALGTLSGSNQEIVARHLVAAGELLYIDPEAAYQHAQAAVRRAGRVDVVREAAALTAYQSGRYEEALREVRAVRRMRGDSSLQVIEADCERGLGRPEKAVEIVESTDTSQLSLEDQVELMLVAAGARADLGQTELSLMIVENALGALPDGAESELGRRLGLLQAERLADLGRDDEAELILAELPPAEEVMEIIDLGTLLDADVDDVRTDLRGSEEPLSARFDGAMLDLDGVCFHGESVYPPGPDALKTAEDNRMQLGFVTNNSSRTAVQVADKLNQLGYSVEANQVMTAAQDLLVDLQDLLPAGSNVLVVGTEALAGLVSDSGYNVVPNAEGEVDAVVQGFGPNVDWEMLTEAAYAIASGAAYYATNLDSTLPTERGFALGNGSLVAAVSRATGKRPFAGGKPRPEIFTRTAQKMHMERPIVVGDRLGTDIAGAVAARFPSLHVLTGVNSARDVVLAERGQRPGFVALDLHGLNEPHPRPLHHRDGTWTCGVSQPVRIRATVIEVGEIPIYEDGDEVAVNLDTYRAIIAAAWDYEDERRRARCPVLNVLPNDDLSGIVTASNKTPQTQPASEAVEVPSTSPISEAGDQTAEDGTRQ